LHRAPSALNAGPLRRRVRKIGQYRGEWLLRSRRNVTPNFRSRSLRRNAATNDFGEMKPARALISNAAHGDEGTGDIFCRPRPRSRPRTRSDSEVANWWSASKLPEMTRAYVAMKGSGSPSTASAHRSPAGTTASSKRIIPFTYNTQNLLRSKRAMP